MTAPTITPLLSGGAMFTINGVDRWCPSRRDALDELAAHQPRGTIDYPLDHSSETTEILQSAVAR